MTVDRQLKKSLRANLLILGDAALQYVREEAERELKRRRLQVRERRASKRSDESSLPSWRDGKADSALVEAARWRW